MIDAGLVVDTAAGRSRMTVKISGGKPRPFTVLVSHSKGMAPFGFVEAALGLPIPGMTVVRWNSIIGRCDADSPRIGNFVMASVPADLRNADVVIASHRVHTPKETLCVGVGRAVPVKDAEWHYCDSIGSLAHVLCGFSVQSGRMNLYGGTVPPTWGLASRLAIDGTYTTWFPTAIQTMTLEVGKSYRVVPASEGTLPDVGEWFDRLEGTTDPVELSILAAGSDQTFSQIVGAVSGLANTYRRSVIANARQGHPPVTRFPRMDISKYTD